MTENRLYVAYPLMLPGLVFSFLVRNFLVRELTAEALKG
jgi:hypothetical protein